MSAARATARRRLALQRFGESLLAGVAGAVLLGALAVVDGLVPSFLVAGGAVLGIALAWSHRSPLADPAHEVDPASDPDGLVRTVLSLSEDAPRFVELVGRTEGRRIRFRRNESWMGLGALAVLALFAAAWSWTSSDPSSRPPIESTDARSADEGSRRETSADGSASPDRNRPDPGSEADQRDPSDPEGGTLANPTGQQDNARPPEGDVPGRRPETATATDWQSVPTTTLSTGSPSDALAVAGPRDLVWFREAVDRYLRQRAQR